MVYARSAPFSRSFPRVCQIAEKHKIGDFSGLHPGKPLQSRHGTSRTPDLCPASIMPSTARFLIGSPHHRGDLGRLQEDPFSRTSRWSTRSLPPSRQGNAVHAPAGMTPPCSLLINPDPVLRSILPDPFISSPWRCFPSTRWISPESPLSYSIMWFMA